MTTIDVLAHGSGRGVKHSEPTITEATLQAIPTADGIATAVEETSWGGEKALSASNSPFNNGITSRLRDEGLFRAQGIISSPNFRTDQSVLLTNGQRLAYFAID